MDATVGELQLAAEPDAVPRARRFARRVLGAEHPLLDDAELVVTELVTNALLHGAPPVTVRVRPNDEGVRVEVDDAGRQMPMLINASGESMTGRGLRLVARVSRAWGVEPGPGCKTMWAQLASGSEQSEDEDLDVDALLDAWLDDADLEPVHTVELGAVPTDLLIEAKAHIDNLVREFTLERSAADTPGADEMPGAVARLVETVLHDFADARAQIKRQAVEAAAAGRVETSLTLRLPASAADAGERYLLALDEADHYARDARLLTLETPPVHRVFRQWYVEAVVDLLRAAAAGRPVPPVPTFLQRLAAEISALAPLRALAGTLSLLQSITAELIAASSLDDVVNVVCGRAYTLLSASTARVYLLADDGMLRSVAAAGDPDAARSYEQFPVDAHLPGADALRSRQPVVLRNLAEVAAAYPELSDVYGDDRALLVAPLFVGDHDLGVLSLTFRGHAAVDEETQRTFLTTLADVTAQAIERVSATSAAAAANERLAFLAEASVVLSSTLDYRTVLESIATLVVPRLADWCAIQLLEHNRLETVALAHVDQAKVAWAREMSARYPDDPNATTGAAQVVRTGRSELYPYIPQDLISAAAVDDEHLQLLQEFGLSSGLVVPLTGRGGVIGALTLIYAESGRRYDESDVAFAEDLARRAALAVETAHAFLEQSGRLATVMRVAEAAQHAILAAPPARVGPVALAARYVSAAAEALVGGDLYEVVEVGGGVRLLTGDVRGKGLDAVRLATVVLGEFRAVAADARDLRDVARQIDGRLRRYLDDEDFVTAVLADIRDDGQLTVVSCAHPPPVIASRSGVREVAVSPALPLGLGTEPVAAVDRLEVGDRMLLYTDGIIEARDVQGRFVDVPTLMRTLGQGSVDEVLDRLLVALQRAVGGSALGDDLAMLVAEFRGPEPPPS